jgi:hypothetical protein
VRYEERAGSGIAVRVDEVDEIRAAIAVAATLGAELERRRIDNAGVTKRVAVAR